MLRIARDGRAADAVRRRQNAATDTAIRAGGANGRARRVDVHAARFAPVLAWKSAPLPVARHEAGADDEIAEALAGLALLRVGGEQRIERRDDAVVLQILGVELGQARAVERGAEIEVVAAGAFADQADLGEIGPRAAVRAAGHADDDVVLGKAVRARAARPAR